MSDSERLAAIRRALGFSVTEMGETIGLSGDNAGDRVREMERGAQPVSGPISRLLEYIVQAVDIEQTPAEFDLVNRLLPRFLDCSDLAEQSKVEIVFHTRWPRFFGFLIDDFPDNFAEEINGAGMTIIDLPAKAGLGKMAILFLDKPVRDPSPIIGEVAKLKIEQALRDLYG